MTAEFLRDAAATTRRSSALRLRLVRLPDEGGPAGPVPSVGKRRHPRRRDRLLAAPARRWALDTLEHMFEHRPMAATESGLDTTLRSSVASIRTELVGPGTTLADERLLPVVPALRPLLPGRDCAGGRRWPSAAPPPSPWPWWPRPRRPAPGWPPSACPTWGSWPPPRAASPLSAWPWSPPPAPGSGRRWWPPSWTRSTSCSSAPRPAPGPPGPPPRRQGPRAWSGPRPPRRLARAGRPAPGRHPSAWRASARATAASRPARSRSSSPAAAPPPANAGSTSGSRPKRHDRPGPLQPGRGPPPAPPGKGSPFVGPPELPLADAG